MEVKIDKTPEDFIDFNLYHHLKRSPEFRRYLLRRQFLFPIAMISSVLIIGTMKKWRPANYLALLTVTLIGLVWIMWYPIYLRKSIVRRVQDFCRRPENFSKLGDQWVVIGPEGVQEANEYGERRVDWRGIQDIIATDKHVFIYFSSIEAFTIPRRAFPDDTSFEDFIDTARKYYEAAMGIL